MTMRHNHVVLLMFVGIGAAWGQQQFSEAELGRALEVKMRTVQHAALNPLLVRAVARQNAQALTLEEIRERDESWRSSADLTPFKLSLQRSPAGRFLQDLVTRDESISEAFLTDNQGANVAAYPATSDYWQGDEEKWIKSFNNGQGVVYIGPLQFDESSNGYSVQISAPVLNRGETVGVLVAGITLTYIQQKTR